MNKHTAGPWRAIIDDTGDRWTGWPISISPVGDDERSVVRPGGLWPYEWDASTSKNEALANARLIAAAPDLLEALQAVVSVADRNTAEFDKARAAIAKATQ